MHLSVYHYTLRCILQTKLRMHTVMTIIRDFYWNYCLLNCQISDQNNSLNNNMWSFSKVGWLKRNINVFCLQNKTIQDATLHHCRHLSRKPSYKIWEALVKIWRKAHWKYNTSPTIAFQYTQKCAILTNSHNKAQVTSATRKHSAELTDTELRMFADLNWHPWNLLRLPAL